MSDQAGGKDVGAIWREQPEEELVVNLEQIVNRRTEELSSNTRSEIVLSMGAALLFVGVMVWRFAPNYDRFQEIGFGAIIAWVVISLYLLRRRIWERPPCPDAAAATCLEYYRKELERRRDHLRNPWLWHGPLFLACMILIAVVLRGKAFQPLRNVAPLFAVLAVWTGFGVWRRYRQATELQREIDEIEPGAA
jgi:hypothetical protein